MFYYCFAYKIKSYYSTWLMTSVVDLIHVTLPWQPPAAKRPHALLHVHGGGLQVCSELFVALSERPRLPLHSTSLPLLSLHLQNGNSTKDGRQSACTALLFWCSVGASWRSDIAVLYFFNYNTIKLSFKRSKCLFSLGAVPLRRDELVKFALRVQRCCSAVFTDVSPQCSSVFCFSTDQRWKQLSWIDWKYFIN